MSRQGEGKIADSGIAVLKARGACAIKIHGSVFARTGEPDVIGTYSGDGETGRTFAIEVKEPGETLPEYQYTRLVEWQNAGAVVGVATCDKDFIDIAIRRVSNLEKWKRW